jgi:hypothetical protein
MAVGDASADVDGRMRGELGGVTTEAIMRE